MANFEISSSIRGITRHRFRSHRASPARSIGRKFDVSPKPGPCPAVSLVSVSVLRPSMSCAVTYNTKQLLGSEREEGQTLSTEKNDRSWSPVLVLWSPSPSPGPGPGLGLGLGPGPSMSCAVTYNTKQLLAPRERGRPNAFH